MDASYLATDTYWAADAPDRARNGNSDFYLPPFKNAKSAFSGVLTYHKLFAISKIYHRVSWVLIVSYLKW